ncbi:hypothetical protein L218DRAFT_6642 [Marasmius fiardii PR-910]|nr:hypothetical protein L218DRAFT_6642 [Marasmius fiardii PR-910]
MVYILPRYSLYTFLPALFCSSGVPLVRGYSLVHHRSSTVYREPEGGFVSCSKVGGFFWQKIPLRLLNK